MRLFNDFKTLHFDLFNNAVHERIFHAGGLRSFPYQSQCLVCKLSYRPDCLGNPARAFYVESMTPVPHTALDQRSINASESARNSAETFKTLRRVDTPHFIDIMSLMITIGDIHTFEPFGVYDRLWLIDDSLREPDFFMKQLQKLAERGHAYRDFDTGKWDLGRLQKRGNSSKWDWIKLTEEELQAGGYTRR
jgi:hypothetical protein